MLDYIPMVYNLESEAVSIIPAILNAESPL
jgi:hypothetical protein